MQTVINHWNGLSQSHKNFVEYKNMLGGRPHDDEVFWMVLELQMGRHLWPRWAMGLTLVIVGVAILCQ